jgi:hypothetical protein
MNIKEWIIKNKNNSPYLKYVKNYLTQFGDDGIIEQIIKELNVETEDKICVEFGAWDGVYLSNVYNLWKNNGFKSILIEGDNSKYNELSNILAKIDENGDLLENYRFKEKSYLEFVNSEKNKLI